MCIAILSLATSQLVLIGTSVSETLTLMILMTLLSCTHVCMYIHHCMFVALCMCKKYVIGRVALALNCLRFAHYFIVCKHVP